MSTPTPCTLCGLLPDALVHNATANGHDYEGRPVSAARERTQAGWRDYCKHYGPCLIHGSGDRCYVEDDPAYIADMEAREMRHCDGCGEDYNAFEESHVGHETPRVDTVEAIAQVIDASDPLRGFNPEPTTRALARAIMRAVESGSVPGLTTESTT